MRYLVVSGIIKVILSPYSVEGKKVFKLEDILVL